MDKQLICECGCKRFIYQTSVLYTVYYSDGRTSGYKTYKCCVCGKTFDIPFKTQGIPIEGVEVFYEEVSQTDTEKRWSVENNDWVDATPTEMKEVE